MKFINSSPRGAASAVLPGICMAALLLLQTCDNPTTEPQPKPVNPNPGTNNPPGPLPETSCNVHVIDGYTEKISYDMGDRVTAYIKSDKDIDACKLTIYNVNGEVAFSVASPMIKQTVSSDDPAVKGFGYNPTVTFDLPKGAKSGVYLIEKKIPFIVKTREAVDLVVVYASNTANAYCESGGRSLYSVNNKPVQVSFQRPIALEYFSPACLRWFEKLDGFTINYIADSDLDDWESISQAKIIVLVGHNEYWTREGRVNFDRFVDNGGDALILSGNTMWWQVRYADNRTKLVCFKELPDPINDLLAQTKNWDNPQLFYPIIRSIGADFPRGGYGLKSDAGWNGFKIFNPKSPLLEGTGLAKGMVLSCPSTELDGAPIASFDAEGYPVIDMDKLGFDKVELIGFDKGYRVTETYGTFIVLKKNASSGTVVNTASCDWCSEGGMGGKDADKMKKITLNALTKLKNRESVFSE
jgi:hypothetical protein